MCVCIYTYVYDREHTCNDKLVLVEYNTWIWLAGSSRVVGISEICFTYIYNVYTNELECEHNTNDRFKWPIKLRLGWISCLHILSFSIQISARLGICLQEHNWSVLYSKNLKRWWKQEQENYPPPILIHAFIWFMCRD